MSSLRNKIDRGRTAKKKSPPPDEDDEDEPGDELLDKNDDEESYEAEKEESEHEPEEDHDDEASDEEVTKPSRGRPKKSPKKKASPKKQAAAKDAVDEEEYAEPPSEESEPEPEQKDDEDYHESDDEEDEDESFDEGDDDDDEDFGQKSKKRKAAPAKKKKASRAVSKKKKPPAKKTRTSSRARKPTKYASDESSSHDDEEEEEYDEKPAARSSRRRDSNGGRRASPRSRKRVITSYKVDGSSGDENNDSENDSASYSHDVSSNRHYHQKRGHQQSPFASSSSSKRTPAKARAAAAKATAKIHQLRYRQDREAEDEEEEDDVPISSLKTPSARKKKKIDSDEEEFQVMDDDQEKSDDDLDGDATFSGDESFQEGMNSAFSNDNDKAIGNVMDEDFCEDEQSDDGNAKSPEGGATRRKAAADNNSLYQSNSDDDPEIGPTPTKARLSQEERTKTPSRHSKSAPPRLPDCPSTHDEITTDVLPRIHVCCLAPDGQSRQCFALETLHKIATMSSHPQYRTNLSDQQQLTFLQPPHFRSAMSEDLLDQVASRFGRQSLDLNGEFYKRNRTVPAAKASTSDDDEEEDEHNYLVNFTSAHTDTDGFMDSWKEYQLRNMGSQDIYPCPLCYVVAHHRLSSEEATPVQIPKDFSYDPMTVLGSPDDEDFDIAAAFCFKRISQVKQHLRDDHSCNTAKIDSEVFMRYKVGYEQVEDVLALAGRGKLAMLYLVEYIDSTLFYLSGSLHHCRCEPKTVFFRGSWPTTELMEKRNKAICVATGMTATVSNTSTFSTRCSNCNTTESLAAKTIMMVPITTKTIHWLWPKNTFNHSKIKQRNCGIVSFLLFLAQRRRT